MTEGKVTNVTWTIEVKVPDGLTYRAAKRLDRSVEASVYELVDQVPEDVHLTFDTGLQVEWDLKTDEDVDEFTAVLDTEGPV
jgi:hypothetical protein